jgi:Dolichyl-phosphate-mannose-protein mannosyltransferase
LIVSLPILSSRDELLVNASLNRPAIRWIFLLCAVVLCLAAWSRSAEYDEQYTLFLTAGVPRPDWPSTVFPAGLARALQSGDSGLGRIARDLRVTDVHPPLYFWLESLWRMAVGDSLLAARLLSVLLGLGALAFIGVIARQVRLSAARAMLLTLGCYGFTYTSVVARGFALAQLLVLAGVACLFSGRRGAWSALAGALFGAATLTNYLAVFAAGACLFTVWFEALRPGAARLQRSARPRDALAASLGFLVFIPADLWYFLAQRDSRPGQFPPFSLTLALPRLASRFSANVVGGLPLYVSGTWSFAVAACLGLLLLWLLFRVGLRWRHIATPRARIMFALAALAPPFGLLALGMVFNNSPIEVRYLTFSTPFLALLLAGALPARGVTLLLAVQTVSIAGLTLAPQTMQPARATALAAAALVEDGVVLLPRGNDGVGVVGAFAIEAPPTLPLLLIRADDTPEQIRVRIGAWHRVVLALLEQDAASRAESGAMREALAAPNWRQVARQPNVEVYERFHDGE